jgi:endonuclease/exonuclease/phosphatase family metal-dependent hydrolase
MKVIFTSLIALLFSGLLAAQNISPKEDNTLRILTYNTHNCIGMDNVADYGRIADVINKVNPDVVALQELDSMTQRSKSFILKYLADRTSMYWTYGPAISYQGGKYGIGILSKEKPMNTRILKLPGREEQRALLIAEFQEYVFCCTHLSLTEEDRRLSTFIILEAVEDISKPVFLGGDMNDVHGSPMQNMLSEKFSPLNDYKQNTFPVKNPNLCIDFIYGYNNGNTYSVLHRQVIDEQMASDHLPVFVDVRLKADKAEIHKAKP